MADEENTLPVPAGNTENAEDACVELRTVLFELGITLEAVSVGFEAIQRSPASIGVKVELDVLQKHFKQGLAYFDRAIELVQAKA